MQFVICLNYLALLLLISSGVESRARLGRNNVVSAKQEQGTTHQLLEDLDSLNEAIKDEIRVEEVQGIEMSPNDLEKDVEEHNKDKPWWKRLARYLKREFTGLVKGVLRKGLEEHVFPALSRQFLT